MKKIIALILASFMLLSLAACGNKGETETQGTTQPITTEATEAMKEILVIVVHSDGTEKEFIYETSKEFMAELLIAEGLIEVEDKGSGMEVMVADGEAVESGYAWIAYENEYLVEQPLDSARIMDGTVYKLVYTAFSY